jgi:hypothetical protein
MKRTLCVLAFLTCVALGGALASSEQDKEKEKRRGPLAGLRWQRRTWREA